MSLEELILSLFLWNFFGAVALIFAHCLSSGGVMYMTDGWEFVNPIYIYRYNRVNWFGAIMVALVYNLVCPVGAIIYWFYKLCTVGRE